MPPYGSNPKLTDQEIVDALTYIRSLAVEPQAATNGSIEEDEENCLEGLSESRLRLASNLNFRPRQKPEQIQVDSSRIECPVLATG